MMLDWTTKALLKKFGIQKHYLYYMHCSGTFFFLQRLSCFLNVQPFIFLAHIQKPQICCYLPCLPFPPCYAEPKEIKMVTKLETKELPIDSCFSKFNVLFNKCSKFQHGSQLFKIIHNVMPLVMFYADFIKTFNVSNCFSM